MLKLPRQPPRVHSSAALCTSLRGRYFRGLSGASAAPGSEQMTPLQNDPQQHQREAKHRKCRVSRGGKRSPDSESARRELSKSGLASQCGPQKCDFASNSGGGTTAGAPKWTRVRPRRNQGREPPIAYAVGEKKSKDGGCKRSLGERFFIAGRQVSDTRGRRGQGQGGRGDIRSRVHVLVGRPAAGDLAACAGAA